MIPPPQSRLELFVLAVALATLGLFGAVPLEARWSVVGGDLLGGDAFTVGGADGWRTSEGRGEIRGTDRMRLEVHPEHGMSYCLHRVDLDESRYYRLDARTAVEEVVAQPGRNASARFVLIALDEQDRPLYHLPHRAGEWFEREEEFLHSTVVHVNKGIERADFGVNLFGSSGAIELSTPRLVPVKQRVWFTLASLGLLACWCYLTWRGLRWTFRRTQPRLLQAALAVVLFGIGVGTMLPSHMTSQIARELRDAVMTQEHERQLDQPALDVVAEAPATPTTKPAPYVPAKRFYATQKFVRKAGHFVFYALLGALVFATRGSRSARTTIRYCFAVACMTELMQFFSIGRTPAFLDVGIDMAGVFTALVGLSLLRERVTSPTPSASFELLRDEQLPPPRRAA